MSCSAIVEVLDSVVVESDCRTAFVAVVEQAVDVLDTPAAEQVVAVVEGVPGARGPQGVTGEVGPAVPALYGAADPDNAAGANGQNFWQGNGKLWEKIAGVWGYTGIQHVPMSLVGANDGVATLVGGKIPEHQLPALAVTDVSTVASEAAMLAMSAQRGDIAVRSDVNKSFVLAAEPASTLSNWVELRTPTDAVLSVAGKTGAVALAKGDVGLGNVDNTADANKPVSTAQAEALAPINANLTDATGANTLPTTGGAAITALLQTVRNCLKWLLAKVDTKADTGMVPAGSTNAIALTDVGGAVAITANTTIPTNASVAIPVGACVLLQCGSTARTITGPASSSLVLEGSATAVTSFTLKANKGAVIRKTATDAWHVYGDVS